MAWHTFVFLSVLIHMRSVDSTGRCLKSPPNRFFFKKMYFKDLDLLKTMVMKQILILFCFCLWFSSILIHCIYFHFIKIIFFCQVRNWAKFYAVPLKWKDALQVMWAETSVCKGIPSSGDREHRLSGNPALKSERQQLYL